jgi:glycosyltransferase involved in cell wall biosynthesis
MDKCRVGVVIPAYNEAETIANIVRAARKYAVPIVVDDGSIDGTATLALKWGAVVVFHESNRGYDIALNSGFKKAADLGLQVIITLDADGQHAPMLIQQFIDAIDSGADIVVGVRNKLQRITEHIFSLYTNVFFGLKDPLCGMKAYRISIYRSLGHFDSYGSVGTELMFYAIRKRYKLKQIAFTVCDRNGESRFGKIFSANYKIIRAMIFTFLPRKSPQS